jgi:hypothetical protein
LLLEAGCIICVAGSKSAGRHVLPHLLMIET